MRATIVRPADLGPQELDLWRRFQAAAGLHSPFHTPEFVQCVGEVSPSARVAVLFDGAEVVGFLPFSARRFGAAKGIGCIARRVDMSNAFAFIAPGADRRLEDVVRAAGIDFLEFSLLPAQQRPATGTARRLDALYIDLSEGFAAYVADLKRRGGKYLRTLMQKRRSEHGRDAGLRFEYASQDPALVPALCAMKSARLRELGQPDFFALARVRELIERVAAARAPGCSGSVSCLRSGERLLAVNLGVTSAHGFWGWLAAFEPGEARRAPGTVCLLSLIEAVADSGLELFDLGPGDHEYKRRLASRATDVYGGTVGRPSLGRRATVSLSRLVGSRALRRAMRSGVLRDVVRT